MKQIKEDFPELPKIKERKKYVYVISALFFIFVWFTGLFNEILSKIGIEKNILHTEFFNLFLGIIISIILIIILKKDIIRDLKYFFKNFKIYFKYDIILYIIMITVNMALALILRKIVGSDPLNETGINELNLSIPFIFLYGAFIGPFIEECVYRGLLQKIFKNKYLFLITSSLLFGLAHMDIPGIMENPLQLLYLVSYAWNGFIFAYNYRKTGNLSSSIFLHMFSNFISFAIGLL